MSDKNKNKKSPLVTGKDRKSADSLANNDGTLETGSNLPQESDPTTAPIITGVDTNEPVDPNPTSLGETPSPTERSLNTEDKLRDSYGRPIGSTDIGSTGSPGYPRPSDRTTDIDTSGMGTSNTGSSFGSQGQSSSQSGQDTTEQAKREAQQRGEQAKQKTQEARREAEQGAQRAKREAQQRAKQAKRGFSKMMDEQPLVIGLAAALVGILVGLAFPSTRRENEMMGDVSDSAIQRAKEVAQKTLETAKETVKEEARNQGLTPESLKQEVQDVAQKTADEAQKTAKEEAKKKSNN